MSSKCETLAKPPKASAAAAIAESWQVKTQGKFRVMETLTLYRGLLRLEVWREQNQYWFMIEGSVAVHSKNSYPTMAQAKAMATHRAGLLLEKMTHQLRLTVAAAASSEVE